MNRNFNFDFIRASTIMAIMFFHMMQMTLPHPEVYQFIEVGKFSIDVFFCLSGYLVGTLYWREYKKTGTVNLWWFWLRRWSRTFPLYYLFLIVSYLAVYTSRHEPFDMTYLVFLQNYYIRIPFYLVTWTLCIEEHFYVIVPLLLSTLLLRKNIKLVLYVGIVLLFVPMLSRMYEMTYFNEYTRVPFGYHNTASHLRFDGLIMGVFFAYIAVFDVKIYLPRLRYLCLLSLLAILSNLFLDYGTFYVYGYFTIPLFVSATIYSLRNRPLKMHPYLVRFFEYTAVASYSLFLTHPLLIHVSLLLLKKAHIENEPIKFIFTVFLVFSVGYAFYHFFETHLLEWREKYVPAHPKPKAIAIRERNRNVVSNQ
jgi:peptidoglycan/LPS O-acetylase OafA/YrhL